MNKTEIRRKAKSYFVDNVYPHEAPKEDLQRFLDRVDFDILREIFANKLEQAGLDVSEIHLVSRDRIFHSAPNTSFFGKFYLDTNLITINLVELLSFAAKNQVFDSDLLLLHCLCHEQAHAISVTEFEVADGEYEPENHLDEYGNPEVTSPAPRVGYSTGLKRDNSLEFSLFNESITERLTRAVLRDYVAKTDFMDESTLQDFLVYYITHPDKVPYGHVVGLLECIVTQASALLGVSKQDFWSALLRGFCTTGDITNLDTGWDLDRVFGDGFVDAISEINSSYDMEDIKAWIITGNRL